MSVTVEDRKSRFRSVLSALLALALLAPVGLLFAQVWRTTRDEIETTEREREGVEYLGGLGQLLIAVTDAQAAAVQGRPPARGAVEGAVNAAAQTDQRLGGELGTTQRWTVIRTKIGQLADAGPGRTAVYLAYTEVTDLLLALFGAVRDNAELVRDQDGDTFHLQHAVGAELPTAVVQAARLADLTSLAGAGSAQERQTAAGQIGAAAQGVTTAVDEMTNDLQDAVDQTDSRTLSSSLLGALDRFRRGIEGVTLAATAPNGAGASLLPAARAELQAAAADLNATVLREMDVLLEDRLAELRDRERLTVATAALAVLLALTAALLPVLGRRRRPRSSRHTTATAHPTSPTVLPPDPRTAGGWADRSRGEGAPGFAPQYPQDVDPARWERSDAVR